MFLRSDHGLLGSRYQQAEFLEELHLGIADDVIGNITRLGLGLHGGNRALQHLSLIHICSASGISLDEDELTLAVGKTATLSASGSGLTWTSDDEDVATVNQNGKVTAVGTGECIITVENSDGDYADCYVTVTGDVYKRQAQARGHTRADCRPLC